MRALLDDRFLLLGTLGRGASAAVLRAYDPIRERVVALKLLDESAGARKRHAGADEFEACRRVAHPGVVTAFELGVTRSGPWPRDRPYIVMESVDGQPLNRVVADGPLSAEELRRVAIQLLQVLHLLHHNDLVHRDVKPQNILRSNLSIKLTDFGLAVPTGSREPVGSLSGSLRYLSPESILGQPLDGRADLYSLGLTLAFLATGEPPCPIRVEQAIRWHLQGAAVQLDSRKVGPQLASLVRDLTVRERAQRPSNAAKAVGRLGERIESPSPRASSDRVRLRLDLDAARLGARRVRSLAEESQLREVRTWAEVRRVPFVDLRRGVAALRELALRESAESPEWRPFGRRTGLHWHRSTPLVAPAGDESLTPAKIRSLLTQLFQLVGARGMVLVIGAAEERDWGSLLRSKAAATPRTRRDRCGYLLLTHRRW